jgi:hypothetical protein
MFGDLSRKVQQLLASIRAKQEIVNTQVCRRLDPLALFVQ